MLYLKDMVEKFKQLYNIDEEQIQLQLLAFNEKNKKNRINMNIENNFKNMLEQLNIKNNK